MTRLTTNVERTARQLAILAVPLVLATTGRAVAHGGASDGSATMGGGTMGSGPMGGGMMGGGWGIFGGSMGLWALFWMGLVVAIPLYLVITLARRRDAETNERPLSVLRERYARGDRSDDEFERRRATLGSDMDPGDDSTAD